ncbi:MAG: SH3 domain-containing protein [Planctomycetes bacterium]|nr:SH3 domain-containing protein [Planctomycetota bacterium]
MTKRVAVLLAGLALAAPGLAVAKTLSVQVKDEQLRATPTFLGKIVVKLAYGDRLEILQEKGPWVQARAASGATGWIRAASLTTKPVAMKAGTQNVDTTASSDEIALAGKGFNPQVEKEFKNRNADIDFTWVDKMETFEVSTEEMIAFLKEGGVKAPEGAMP